MHCVEKIIINIHGSLLPFSVWSVIVVIRMADGDEVLAEQPHLGPHHPVITLTLQTGEVLVRVGGDCGGETGVLVTVHRH